jgi:hypothetical protein
MGPQVLLLLGAAVALILSSASWGQTVDLFCAGEESTLVEEDAAVAMEERGRPPPSRRRLTRGQRDGRAWNEGSGIV